MATSLQPDLAALQADIQQLRADFAKMTTDMRGLASSGAASAAGKAQESAEKIWADVHQKAQQVGQEIKERPFTSALAAFSTGLILGMLLASRRG